MKLQTEIPLQPAEDPIDHHSKLLMVGSCFSQSIGDKLDYFKFDVLQNPLGILFNPKGIETLLRRAIHIEKYSEGEVFFHNERWHCFDAHSELSSISKGQLLSALNDALTVTQQRILEATHICVTLGTAWVYRQKATNGFVTSCHKVPQKEFSKALLSAEEIVESLRNVIALVRSANLDAQIIFTVSPIRHLKDGFVANQRSKAHLISAIHEVISTLRESGEKSHYFPSYEIVIDELRDYRFYGKDLVHPNELAIDYVWEKFQQAWVAGKARSIMKEVDAVRKGLQHRPFNPHSEQHKAFIEDLEVKIEKLKKELPRIQF